MAGSRWFPIGHRHQEKNAGSTGAAWAGCCLDFKMPVTRIASSGVPCRGGRRRWSSAFSRCMWGSTKPGAAARAYGIDLDLTDFLQ